MSRTKKNVSDYTLQQYKDLIAMFTLKVEMTPIDFTQKSFAVKLGNLCYGYRGYYSPISLSALDIPPEGPRARRAGPLPSRGTASPHGLAVPLEAVSYTHLTLPTKA